MLRALLQEPTREMYGLQVCGAAGLPTGTVHPILSRLEKMEWLTSQWEEVDARRRSTKAALLPIERARCSARPGCGGPCDAQADGLRTRRPGFAGGTA